MATKNTVPADQQVTGVQSDADTVREAEFDAEELLKDLPALLPPERFRYSNRLDFDELMLDAAKAGIFDDAPDENRPIEDQIDFTKAYRRFIASIDLWAESIAYDKDAYQAWSEGKGEEHLTALYVKYRDALGESVSSAN